MKERSSHKYDGLHRQLDRIGCEMGSREGKGVESGRFKGWTMVLEEMKNKALRIREPIE